MAAAAPTCGVIARTLCEQFSRFEENFQVAYRVARRKGFGYFEAGPDVIPPHRVTALW
jgi:hypothetical protein